MKITLYFIALTIALYALPTHAANQLPETYTDPVTGMEFILVKEGCFQMGDQFGDGDEDEQHVHTVCLDDFYIGKYEVTIGEYRTYLLKSGEEGGVDWGEKHCPMSKKSYELLGHMFSNSNQQPMVELTWFAAEAMAKWLSDQADNQTYRLPTEAQWEYAARSGGKKEKYAGGKAIMAVAWFKENSFGHTYPVGQKAANGLGLYDMSGNVLEWCHDWFSLDYYPNSQRKNPQGPKTGLERVRRGGSWINRSHHVRTSYRRGQLPSDTSGNVGFRLVVTPNNPVLPAQ